MKKKMLFLFVLIFGAGMLLYAAGQQAPGDRPWPTRPITIVVPWNPGGDSDFNARAYADRIQPILGRPAVVQNMAGSGGAVGARHVYNSAPDGYTVLFSHTAFFVNRAVGLLDFGIEDLETIAVIGRNAGNVILVNANSPYRTLRELVEASRTASPALTFAVDFGATTHVMGVSVNRAGGRFNLVDLGGAPQRATALMGGHVTAIPNAVGTAVPFLESGEFRALAIIEDERNSFAPNIPTAVEQGYDVVFPMYYFFAFPRGTPREIVERFANACEQISRMPEYQRSIGDTFLQRPYFAKLDAARQVLERQQTEIYAMREILLAR